MTRLAFGPGNLTCLLIVEFLIDFPSKDFLINTLRVIMGENHRGFDEPTSKQRKRREKKAKKMQREGFEPPNP